MKLEELIRAAGISAVIDRNLNISSIQSDSRKVEIGCLFVAVRGTVVDGHQFIEKAITQGAICIVCEEVTDSLKSFLETLEEAPVIIQVPNSAVALGNLLSAWYGHPSRKLTLVGVTGTNGKTTIATLLYELFRKFGHKAGLISTVCNYIDGQKIPTDHTTPDPITLHALIANMEKAGCEYAFMEVSSHAIDQDRISGLFFSGGIFTNLTRDHLDYHKTVENYLRAKKKFFDNLPVSAFALTNADDKSGLTMLQNTKAKKSTYALRTFADFKGKVLEFHFEGTDIFINDRAVSVQFVGKFNVYNLLAVYGAAVLLGKDPDAVLVNLSSLHPVSGRFQTMRSPLGYMAIVDYAHTPDALVNVLNSIREVLQKRGHILTVVGCGGNRDKGKRPIMAKEAAKLSDQLILTSDNPRFEKPEDIIQDMVAGLKDEDLQKTICIADRSQAIKTATLLAKKGDVILVAGKGHENCQEINGEKHHFDDREQLQMIFDAQAKL